jgi:hypothetical protein
MPDRSFSLKTCYAVWYIYFRIMDNEGRSGNHQYVRHLRVTGRGPAPVLIPGRIRQAKLRAGDQPLFSDIPTAVPIMFAAMRMASSSSGGHSRSLSLTKTMTPYDCSRTWMSKATMLRKR